jgi:hypothetical protein
MKPSTCTFPCVISVPVTPKFARIWVLIYLRMISLLLHSVTFPRSCIPLWKTQKICKIAELAFCHITTYGNALHFMPTHCVAKPFLDHHMWLWYLCVSQLLPFVYIRITRSTLGSFKTYSRLKFAIRRSFNAWFDV